MCINLSYNFANEREQFSRKIADFGMLQKKLAEMVVRSWEADSLNYMTCGSIDEAMTDIDKNKENYFEIVQKVIEDHAIEASICKVVGSEALAYCVDEGVQIHGGAGFIEDILSAQCIGMSELIEFLKEQMKLIDYLLQEAH